MTRRALAGITGLLASLLAFAYLAPLPAQAKPVSSSPAPSLRELVSQGERECIQPPRHIDPKALSNARLALYGLPDRRTLQSNASWAVMLAHYKHRSCGAGHAIPKVPFAWSASPEVTGNGGNWAGNWAYGGRGTYQEADIQFNVPYETGPDYSIAGFWSGVGGVPSQAGSVNELIQAGVGVEIEPTSDGGQWRYNYAWYEQLNTVTCPPDEPTYDWPASCDPQPMSITLYPGNTIAVFVTSNLNGDDFNGYTMCNYSLKTCTDSSTTGSAAGLSDSATGECIGEEPAYQDETTPNSKVYLDANFGTEELSDCDLTDNSGTENPIQDWSHNYSWILAPNGGTLVDVGPIDSTGADFPLNFCSPEGSENTCSP